MLSAVALAPPAATAHSHNKKGLEIVHPWTPATTEKTAADTGVREDQEQRRPIAAPRLPTPWHGVAPTNPSVPTRQPCRSPPSSSVPAGDVELVRNGPHLLLSGVKKRLNAYDSFKLTLVFEKAGTMVVEVAVEEAATVEPHKH